jgi:hypothetical protein
MEELLAGLGAPFGVLVAAGTHHLSVNARHTDVALGDLFLLPGRGPDRVHVFRATGHPSAVDDKRIELKGLLLGHAQRDAGGESWSFHLPRRLPPPSGDVYHVDPANPRAAAVVRSLLRSQLGEEGLYIGELLAGGRALAGVRVYLPPHALSHHVGIFGRPGSGKSHLLRVLLRSIDQYNRTAGPRCSVLAGGPHDPHPRRVLLSRADVVPDDLLGIGAFPEQQAAFAYHQYATFGDSWIGRLLLGDDGEAGNTFLPGTVQAVQRQLAFLRHGQTRLLSRFDPEAGLDYTSSLPDIVCDLEKGTVIVIDTTRMTQREQALLTTVVARVLFSLRQAVCAAGSGEELPGAVRQTLGNDVENGQVGMQSLADELVARLERGELPYRDGQRLRSLDELPLVNLVVEEAEWMCPGSFFRTLLRQGRKVGVGLTVVAEQVSALDPDVLTRIGTHLILAQGNERERRKALRYAPVDLRGWEGELRVLGRGQLLGTTAYRDVPLPVQIPDLPDPSGPPT